MQWVKSFAAGALATLVFHQGLLALLYFLGVAPVAPYNWSATEPLGVPVVLSLAFWGGVWALPLWWLVRYKPTRLFWLVSLLFGAIAPTVVAMLLVFPLKGLPVSGATWAGGLLLNGAWGLGTALFMGPVFRCHPRSPVIPH
ncbi:hypothetical protein [Alloalcanivorax marinus]|uniref:hypothetical protein n=1 Tax=Alloalcanivorax marinus TaxID=1177169 RepID=UPI0021CE6E23|nr:hypothetical protein [Alloalcanivorax marinus]MCU5788408.1 hypothetical protein [Alloalcanivorax marinus]